MKNELPRPARKLLQRGGDSTCAKTFSGSIPRRSPPNTLPAENKKRKHDRTEAALAFSNKRFGVLARVANTVVGAAPLAQQMRELAETVRAAYDADACAIRVIENEDLTLLACAGVEEAHLPSRIPLLGSLAGEVIARRAPLFIRDVRSHPVTDPPSGAFPSPVHQFISYAGAPLMAQEKILGKIGIYTAKKVRNFTESDLELLQIIATHIAVAIVNDSLYKEIHRLNSELEQRVQWRTAELQATNKELEAFSYSVSHDLRAPLRGISGFTQVLHDDYQHLLDEDGRANLDRVIQSTRQMDSLINDLLHLSRLTRGEMKRQPLNLSALVESLGRKLRERDPERRVAMEITPNLTASGDPRLLRIALENLLNNAWKFTQKKTDARIEFGMENQAGGPAYFVRDNGAGFDLAFADKLFHAFQRLHKASEFPGHGIGLATVQRVINRHGGCTWASGEIGRGAVFYFTLPA